MAGRLGIRVIEVDCSRGLADVAELVAEAFPAHLPLGPDAALIVVDV